MRYAYISKQLKSSNSCSDLTFNKNCSILFRGLTSKIMETLNCLECL